MLELQRWRVKRGLSFNLQPAHWPFPFQTADRMVIAAVQAGHNPSGFMRNVFKGIWEEQKNFAEEAELVAAADAAGLPGTDLLSAADGDDARTVYDANTKGFMEVNGFDWHEEAKPPTSGALMERTRRAARRLIGQGQLEMLQRGQRVDPSTARGAIRLRKTS